MKDPFNYLPQEEDEFNYLPQEEDDNKSDSDSSDISELIELETDGTIPETIHQNLWYNEQEFKKEVYNKYILYLKQLKASIQKNSQQQSIQKYINTLSSEVQGENKIDYHFNDELKALGLIMFPNFATASISYIKAGSNQAHTKNIRFPTSDGRTQKQIVEYVQSKKLNKEKYKEAKMVVIDIHSKLSFSKEEDIKLLGFEGVNAVNSPIIKIRQSFDIKCNFTSPLPDTDSFSVKQWYYNPKEFEGKLLTNKNSFIVSSGGSNEVKEIIEVVRNQLTSKAIIDNGINELKNQLKNKYIVQDVPHDGNCFFHAIALQLGTKDAYQQIRTFKMDYMKKKPQHFSNIDSVLEGKETFEEYINRMYSNGQWITNTEKIQAFADRFNVNINIIDNNNLSTTAINSENALNTIFIGNINNKHYVALRLSRADVDNTTELFTEMSVSGDNKQLPEGSSNDEHKVYYITEIIYDNPILNNASLLNNAVKLFGFNKALNLYDGLDPSLVQAAIDNSNDDLILSGLVSLYEDSIDIR